MIPSEQSYYATELETQRYYSEMYGGQLIMNNSYYQANSMRTVYLGNIPNDISISEIIDHVKTGPIQAIRPLLDKNGMFITFLDTASANQFFHEAQQNRLTIQGNELKIGWGKPSTISTTIQDAVQLGATRNVYLGSLDESITESELRQDLSRFGHIEHVKIITEKKIAFVHFLCITNAVKCVNTLPHEPKWQSKRINFGKDRCNRLQQQHVYFLPHQQLPPPTTTTTTTTNNNNNISSSPTTTSTTTSTTTDSKTETTAIYHPQLPSIGYPTAYDMYTGVPLVYHDPHYSVANRTIYLGNIHPDTTAEDICNVIRGGILSQIRFLPDKHIAFLTFIDPHVASMLYHHHQHQCIVIKNRRIKVGWGKSSALPLSVVRAVQSGGSRNVYVGNIDDSVTEEKLKHDFSEYGDIELVNTLKEKNCAFVNFTSIASAIRAIDGIRTKEEYKKFRINYGKDRCGNPPRQQKRLEEQS
jgi:RNA recognition motif-containing protein